MARKKPKRTSRSSERKSAAPTADYLDEDGNVLTLRGSLTLGTRRKYAETLGRTGDSATTPEDNAHRAEELLFERLAVRWQIAGVPLERQRELLQRYRWANQEERRFVRRALREHCGRHFPEMEVP